MTDFNNLSPFQKSLSLNLNEISNELTELKVAVCECKERLVDLNNDLKNKSPSILNHSLKVSPSKGTDRDDLELKILANENGIRQILIILKILEDNVAKLNSTVYKTKEEHNAK